MIIGAILIIIALIGCILGFGTYIKYIPPFLVTNYIIGTKAERNELKNNIQLCKYAGILLMMLGGAGILFGVSILVNVSFFRYIGIAIVFIAVIYGLFKTIKGEIKG